MPNWVNDYRAGHVQVENAGLQTIAGVTRIRVAANSDIRKDASSGSPYPLSAHLVAVEPVLSFTTMELLEAITNLTLNGVCTTDFRAFGQAQDCQGVKAGTTHDYYGVAKGSIVPTSLSIDHQGNAELSYDIYAASSDGSAAPVSRSTGVALPALTTPKRYEMYDLTVAGTTIEGKRNVTINFNPTVTLEGADSNIYPTAVSLSSLSPVMSIRGVDPNWLASIGIDGARGTAANTILRFKDRDQLTTATSHISIAANCQVSWNTPFDAGPAAPAETDLQCDVYSTNGTAPLTVGLGVAL